jgi:hypothetical protein
MAIGPETATLGVDDRGEPVIQLSPPLIAETEEFELMHDVLHATFTEAGEQIAR